MNMADRATATKPLLDLVQLWDLLGPDHSTMHDDLVLKLK
jgi:hypothetical protein